jgi:hypothetical protein
LVFGRPWWSLPSSGWFLAGGPWSVDPCAWVYFFLCVHHKPWLLLQCI